MAACQAERSLTALRHGLEEATCAGRGGPAGELAGDARRPMPGSRIGRFRLLRELNGGATAVVYEAVDAEEAVHGWEATQRVALKVMRLTACGSLALPPSLIAQEIRLAALFCHRNIVGLLDVVPDNERLALVLELVDGPDLLEYTLRCSRAVPESHAVHYFRQLLDAVTHMHAVGVTHRDLKPENCMVDLRTHTLKVIDFGLAAPLGAPIRQGCGTVHTVAPECIIQAGRPPPTDDAAIDVWGLGVTLYILLAGRHPFLDARQPGADAATLRNTVAGRMAPLPGRVSPAARDLVASLLAVDPAARPPLAAVAQHPFLHQRVPFQAMFAHEARVFAGRYGLPNAFAGPNPQRQPAAGREQSPEAQSPHRPLPAPKEVAAGEAWRGLLGGGRPRSSPDTSLSDESSSSTS